MLTSCATHPGLRFYNCLEFRVENGIFQLAILMYDKHTQHDITPSSPM